MNYTELKEQGNFALDLGTTTPQVSQVPNVVPNAATGSTIEQKARSGRYDTRGVQLLPAVFGKDATENGAEFTVKVTLTGKERDERNPRPNTKPALQIEFQLPTDAANYEFSNVAADVQAAILAKGGKKGFTNWNEICAEALASGKRFDVGTVLILRASAIKGDNSRINSFFVVDQA